MVVMGIGVHLVIVIVHKVCVQGKESAAMVKEEMVGP
jgi:hypothetical protein